MVFPALLFVLRHTSVRKQVVRASGEVFCGGCLVSSCGSLVRSVKSGDLKLQLELYPSVSDMGKMFTVVYAVETRFFSQRVILRIAPIVAMLHTSKRLADPTSGPRLDSHARLQRVSRGAFQHHQQQGSRGSPGGTNLFLTKETLRIPGDNVADPRLDARVLSIHWNSAVDRHGEFRDAVSDLVQSLWAGWLVSGPRIFLWCCKYMSEHAVHILVHHSRFVQFSGLVPRILCHKNNSCFIMRSSLG